MPKDAAAGGWNYYAFVGGSNTFVTASVMRTLLDLQKDMKLKIPAEALKKAYGVFKEARFQAKGQKAATYKYDVAKRGPDNQFRGHMGRSNSAEFSAVMYCDRGLDNGGEIRNLEHLNKSLNFLAGIPLGIGPCAFVQRHT